MPDTHHAYEQVQNVYFPIAIAVFAIVVGTLVVLLVRGARRQRPGARSEALALEVAYAGVLACIAAFLVWITFRAETPIDRTVAHPGLRLEVVAAQWSWRFQYPDGVVVTAISTWHPPVALVPTGVEVEFAGTSRDVIHGFWVPQLHFMRQILPGYVTHFDLIFRAPGLYGGSARSSAASSTPRCTSRSRRSRPRPSAHGWPKRPRAKAPRRRPPAQLTPGRRAPEERGHESSATHRGSAGPRDEPRRTGTSRADAEQEAQRPHARDATHPRGRSPMNTLALPRRAGPLSLVSSTDHKRIAASACAVAFVFFIAGGVLALIMRSQLAADGGVVSQNTYNQLFTMHGSTMVYLFVVPVALTVGLYLVPLQVGAAEVAGPRIALAGLWLLVCGGVTMWSGFLTAGGAASASWWGFDPLSESIHSPGSEMELWIFGVIMATLGQLLWAGCVLLTALRHRAPGMTLMRPVFTWTMVATCLLTIFAFPALILALGLLWAQRHFGGVLTGGLGAVDYQQLFWFYGHPVVYVMFFPFVGMVGEIIATFSSRRFFGHSAFIVALLAFSGLSMTVWGHHMFTMGQSANKYFSLTSTALVVPAGVEYFDFLATIWGGKLRFTTAFLFAVGFLVQFLIGGLTGVILASPPLDYAARRWCAPATTPPSTCSTAAASSSIAPSAQHRFLFRYDDKRHIVFTANRIVIAGLGVLALAMCGCLLLVATKLLAASSKLEPHPRATNLVHPPAACLLVQ